MKDYIEKNVSDEKLAYFFIGLYLVLSIIWHFSTNAPWDDDCVGRYFNTKRALSDPMQFISRWNRPLFVALFVLPFQLSKHMVLMMAILSGAGAVALYRSVVQLKMRNAFLVVPLLLFQTFYFTASRSSLTEPLIAIILSLGLYFYLNKKWLWFAIIGSLIPLARLEISAFLFLWAFYLYREKQLKYVLILGIPTLLWNFGGTILEGDWLWLVNETIGNDAGVNRYGQTSLGHYFQRYIYITGPFIFYFLFIGLLENIYRKRINTYIDGQFVLGFAIYVLFSWKLSLGQAAGFLRHLVALSPLAALLALQGINYWYQSILKKQDTPEIIETKSDGDVEEQEILDRIALLEEKMKSGELKRKQARHEINKEKNKLELFKINVGPKSGNEDRSNTKSESTRIIIYSIIIVALTYFFFSKELVVYHNFSGFNDFSNLGVIAGLLLLYLTLRQRKTKLHKYVQKIVSLCLVLLMISFTVIKEPPNAHNSMERSTMTKVAVIYDESNFSTKQTYVNHPWLAWASDVDQSDVKKMTVENLMSAPDSSIIVWETHYSNRLSGNVPQTFFPDKKEFVELIRFSTDSMNFNAVVYQKLPQDRTKEDVLKLHDRLIAKTEYKAEAILSKARSKWYYLNEKDSGLEDCKKALEMKPNSPLILFEIANLYLEKKDYSKAEKYYDKTIELLPNHYFVYYKAGVNYAGQKKYDQAIKSLDLAIAIKKDKNTYIERGNVYFSLQQFNEAIKDYQEAIMLDPNGHLAYYNIGICKLKQLKQEEGCKYLRKALQNKSPLAGNVFKNYCK